MTDLKIDKLDKGLLGKWQRDLPLVSRPFAVLAKSLGISQADVIARLERLCEIGAISRVGAIVRPNIIGASTLAAMSVPEKEIEECADIISKERGVNHSYLRENKMNFWFVATGPDRNHVTRSLAKIEKSTGKRVLDLPLERSYHIDLGFPLDDYGLKFRESTDAQSRSASFQLLPGDNQLVQTLTQGLPLAEQPFHLIAKDLLKTEKEVISRLKQLCDAQIIKRIGVIVRHRALGWRSNAMVVWDVPTDEIDYAGAALASVPGINLCYRRTRLERDWPYNLYCMVHAKKRAEALEIINKAVQTANLFNFERQILFSTRCFKQIGALVATPLEAA